jgi:uncharacterized membrane-anchored protein
VVLPAVVGFGGPVESRAPALGERDAQGPALYGLPVQLGQGALGLLGGAKVDEAIMVVARNSPGLGTRGNPLADGDARWL